MEQVLYAVVGAVLGLGGGFGLRIWLQQQRERKLGQQAADVVQQAEQKAGQIVHEAKKQADTEVEKRKGDAEDEILKRKKDVRKLRRQAEKRLKALDTQSEQLNSKEERVEQQREKFEQKLATLEVRQAEFEQEADDTRKKLDETVQQQEEQLHEISQLSPSEARDRVMSLFEEKCQGDLAEFAKKNEELKKEKAEEIAQRVVGNAIQRCAVRFTAETVTSTIDLPSDEMKGRIIGREGRNIRAIERATGVDVIVDDTPGVIVISCFDKVRREVARRTLESLVQDGRIHPARVDELVQTNRKEIDEDIRKTGKKACQELRLGRVHPQIQFLVGRLKYRTSYGQNVLEHSMEVAHIMSMVASELKLDPDIARRCGLLHDIGKALTHEVDGSHAVIGAEQARRFDEPRKIWNAIGAHHEDMPYESVYAVLTQVGDAISASRPGARRDTIEHYIERLEKLEATASAFEGIENAFALQAGRELRVMADADKLNDDEARVVAGEIARKIEEELTYPGEIKVTLVRERKITEVAR